ncbi:MAG: methionine adenosyltransferase [Oscillospiraceae bacterium]|jgi:S-adenosylmethionine synthetase|nr:methionine adenosyltransferase [Oscillospiraceae bacterium]
MKRKTKKITFFTSESVTEGHPDKVCDQIADAILDAIIKKDPEESRVACEVAITKELIHVMGEISTKASLDIAKIAKGVVCSVGYTHSVTGFDGNNCSVILSVNPQSEDIAIGVNHSFEERLGFKGSFNKLGASDQGTVFGFACNESPNLMPLPIFFANRLAFYIDNCRKNKKIDYLMPDGKAQVTVEYENSLPKRVETIAISVQHMEGVPIDQIREDITKHVILPAINRKFLNSETQILINPTGRFVIGGPLGDTGLTGRKIMVDTYGGYSKHGGGSLSGKDPTKVDRSGSYVARYIAKNIVAAKIAEKCEVQISYVIGLANPISFTINAFGTSRYSNRKILNAVKKIFDVRPYAIIKQLDLRKPIYRNLAKYGQIGRQSLGVKWERTNKIKSLLNAINNFKN